MRAAFIGLGIFAVLAALSYFAGPPLLRSQLESRLSTLLGRAVTVHGVTLNPFTLEARVSGFAISDPDSDKPLLRFDELYVDASIASLKELAPVIAAVRLTNPALNVIRLDGARYNFSDIVERFASDEPASGPGPRFAVGNIEVLDGRIDFDDRPMQARHELSGLQLGVPFVSNFPVHIETKVLPSFAAHINGDPFVLTGETTPFKDSHDTAVKLSLKDVDLPRYLQYVPTALDFKLRSAKLDTDLRVNFAQRGDGALDIRVDGSASLAGVEIVDKSDAALIGFDVLSVDLEQFDLLGSKLAIERVELTAPKVHVRRSSSGAINLDQLLPRTSAAPAKTDASSKPGAAMAVTLAAIKLSGGTVEFVDESNAKPFRTRLTDIDGELAGLTIGEGAGVVTTPARFTTTLKGDKGMSVRSTGTIALAPLTVSGSLNLDRAVLADFAPYYEPVLAAEIADGWLDVAAGFHLKSGAGAFEFGVTQGAATLQSFRLTQKGAEVARIGKLAVEGVELDLSSRSIEIGSVLTTEVRAGVQRAADGSLNLATLVRDAPATTAAAKPAAGVPSPWRYSIKRISLDRTSLRYEDATVKPAVVATIEPVQLTLNNVSSAKNTRSALALRTGVNKGGKLAVTGSVVLDPPAADLTIDAAALDVVPFEPYFTPYVNVAVASGAVSTKGRLTLALPAGAAPQVRYEGDVAVANLDATDKTIAEELLKWRELAITGLKFALEPMSVDIGAIALSDFYSRIVITPQGRINLQTLVAGRDEQPATADTAQPAAGASTPAPGASKPQIKIGKIALQGGTVNFSDFFIKPNYTANLTNLAGGVSEITPESAGDVDIRGRVNNTGALEIAGKLNPLATTLYLDLKAAARDIDLPALTPYSAKYVGYGIQKGKLSVKIAYKIEDDKLTGDNSIFLDQLTFGEKIESPDALKVPVLLAVALLKDRNGVIDISLPISGTLSDPEFSIGGIIVRVLVNLIVKAVTSPFTLLASAFGGGGEELSYAEFAPGRAELSEQTEARLKMLAKALGDRPGLTLEVAGRVAPEHDREGLQRVKLEQQVKAQKFKQLARTSTPVASIDKANYTSAEYDRLLREAYQAASFAKPRTSAGLVRDDLSVAEMEKLILQNAQVSDDDLRALAAQRAQIAKDHLVEHGGITAERIFIVAPKLDAGDLKDQGKPTRVEFALR